MFIDLIIEFISSLDCFHYECGVVNETWVCNPIYFKRVSLWCLFFDPHWTHTIKSRYLIRKNNQISHACLTSIYQKVTSQSIFTSYISKYCNIWEAHAWFQKRIGVKNITDRSHFFTMRLDYMLKYKDTIVGSNCEDQLTQLGGSMWSVDLRERKTSPLISDHFCISTMFLPLT